MKNLLFTFVALALCAGCSKQEKKIAIDPRASDPKAPIRFITHPTQPPTSYINEKGECVGTDVDLARRIADYMNRDLEILAVRFENLLPQLKCGKADMAIATITITESRKRDVDFSEPYGFGGNAFLYRSDGRKPVMSQPATLRVAAETGTTGDIYLCHHGFDPVRYLFINQAVDALQKGEIDAIFFDSGTMVNWAKKSNGKLILSPLETREGYGVAVNKARPDILEAANAVIAKEKTK